MGNGLWSQKLVMTDVDGKGIGVFERKNGRWKTKKGVGEAIPPAVVVEVVGSEPASRMAAE